MADNIADDLVVQVNLDRAIRMRRDGAHWPEVAGACGFDSPAAALRAVGNAMAAATMRAEMTADQYRDEANLRLAHLYGESVKMITEEAPTVYDQDGNELNADDRAVRLRAVDEARRLVESINKLNGVGAPKEDDTDASGGGIRIIFEDRPRA